MRFTDTDAPKIKPVSISRKPNANAIKLLTEILESVKAGEIEGVAVATASLDGRTSSGFSSGGCVYAHLLGGIDILKARYIREEFEF